MMHGRSGRRFSSTKAFAETVEDECPLRSAMQSGTLPTCHSGDVSQMAGYGRQRPFPSIAIVLYIALTP